MSSQGIPFTDVASMSAGVRLLDEAVPGWDKRFTQQPRPDRCPGCGTWSVIPHGHASWCRYYGLDIKAIRPVVRVSHDGAD